MKSFTITFLLATIMVSAIKTQQPAQQKLICLEKISADDRMVGTYSKAHVVSPNQKNVKVNKGRLLQALAQAPNRATNLLKSFFALSKKSQQAVRDCNMNSKGAMTRCEQKHGTGQCEIVAPGLANKKCNSGLKRYGHSLCTLKCPEGWIDRTVDCYKPKGYKTLRYKNKKECKKTHKKCQRFHLKYWVPLCKEGFMRSGSDTCTPVCPEGWMDMGRKCIKSTIVNVGDVFAWNPMDN